jgi:hypothetical protein
MDCDNIAGAFTTNIAGFEIQSEMQAIVFMVVSDENMIVVRDALKPHRGEVYEG